MKQGDYPAAFKEWVKSAADGHLRAQYNLGVLYENGLGVEKNPAQAAKWYIVSAEGNYAPAQYNLAVLALIYCNKVTQQETIFPPQE